MPPLLSLFIPNPVNIYISENTFIRFSNHGRESIGLITGINVEQEVLTLRHFMSWAELLAYVGDEVLANMSFWPDNTNITPKYLCDTDVAIVLPFEQIVGIAFVFHATDPIVNTIQGMGYTYQVTSQFLSNEMTIFHRKSFVSFPSLLENSLPTCFPSSLFKELLSIKQKVQVCLSTRSLHDTYSECCRIDNVNILTWCFMVRDLPLNIPLKEANVVVKRNYFRNDEAVLEKRRCKQLSVDLYLPEHISFAQSIFGTFAGVGSRKKFSCILKCRRLSAVAHCTHQIHYKDEHNIVPFEGECLVEFVKRGIILKYIPEEQQLTVILRFRKMSGRESVEPQFRLRNIPQNNLDDEDDDRIPFHCDIPVFGKKIYLINLDTKVVELNDRTAVSADAVINEFRRCYN